MVAGDYAYFNEQPVISIMADGDCHVKARFGIVYKSDDFGEYHCTIHEGYRCDSASIAPILRGIVSKYNATNAGIVHDYMYKNAHPRRRIADRIFYLLLRRTKLNRLQCWLAYAAVRAFGWLYYHDG